MPNNANKISAFLSAVVDNATKLKLERDRAARLAEAFSNDAVLAGLQDADCTGSNGHLTRTIILNELQVVQPALETAFVAHLANLLACIPTY